mmetsp:Transcript_74864/g.231439  ORF Transcript_74864/g.231439 Transcript_74864/m.231439 type:complete len:262 (-) Transcript_74864:289-1074(-)
MRRGRSAAGACAQRLLRWPCQGAERTRQVAPLGNSAGRRESRERLAAGRCGRRPAQRCFRLARGSRSPLRWIRRRSHIATSPSGKLCGEPTCRCYSAVPRWRAAPGRLLVRACSRSFDEPGGQWRGGAGRHGHLTGESKEVARISLNVYIRANAGRELFCIRARPHSCQDCRSPMAPTCSGTDCLLRAPSDARRTRTTRIGTSWMRGWTPSWQLVPMQRRAIDSASRQCHFASVGHSSPQNRGRCRAVGRSFCSMSGRLVQ